jgi:hypothetical protein
LVSICRYYSSVGALDILFFLFLRASFLDFAKNDLPPLEPKLLVMWERIGEALKMVYSAYQFEKHDISANRSGAI